MLPLALFHFFGAGGQHVCVARAARSAFRRAEGLEAKVRRRLRGRHAWCGGARREGRPAKPLHRGQARPSGSPSYVQLHCEGVQTTSRRDRHLEAPREQSEGSKKRGRRSVGGGCVPRLRSWSYYNENKSRTWRLCGREYEHTQEGRWRTTNTVCVESIVRDLVPCMGPSSWVGGPGHDAEVGTSSRKVPRKNRWGGNAIFVG